MGPKTCQVPIQVVSSGEERATRRQLRVFVEPLNAQLRGQRKRRGLDRTRRTTVLDSLDLCWAFFGMGGSGAFLGGHGGDQKLTLFVPNLDPAMASKHKGRAGPSRSSNISTTAAGRRSGGGGRQLTLSSFMDPKATHTAPQLSPTASRSPSVQIDTVSSTSGRCTNAGEKRKQAEVIDLKSDEEDPPLKRRKLSTDSISSTYSYQASKPGKPSVAKSLVYSSPRKWLIPNLAGTTPRLGSNAYFHSSEISGPYSPLLGEEHSRLRGPSENSSSEDGPTTLLPERGHGADSFGVDMKSDVVPCSQAFDDLFPPLAPSTRASPLQAITPSLQPNSLFLSEFTPKSTRTSQHSVPSSATPSDLRQNYDVDMEPIRAPPVPVFTPCSPGDIEEWSQTNDLLLPPSSFPRCALPAIDISYHLFLLRYHQIIGIALLADQPR